MVIQGIIIIMIKEQIKEQISDNRDKRYIILNVESLRSLPLTSQLLIIQPTMEENGLHKLLDATIYPPNMNRPLTLREALLYQSVITMAVSQAKRWQSEKGKYLEELY